MYYIMIEIKNLISLLKTNDSTCRPDVINPLTASVASIQVFIFISTLSTTF